MLVREFAADVRVEADLMVRYLRQAGVAVGSPNARIPAAAVARVRIRLERERRAGHGSAAQVIRAAVKASAPRSRRRRVRRRVPGRRRARTAPAESPAEVPDPDSAPDATPAAPAAAEAAEPSRRRRRRRAAEPDVAPPAAPVDETPVAPAAEAASPDAETAPELPEPPVAPAAVGDDADAATSPSEAPEVPAQADAPPPEAPRPRSESPEATEASPAIAAGVEPSVDPDPAPATPPGPPSAPPEVERPAAAADPAPAAVRPEPETPGAPTPTPIRDGLPPARLGGPPEPARKGGPRRSAAPPPAASAGPGGTVRIQAEGYTSDGRRKKARRKGKRRRGAAADAAAQNIQRVMAQIKTGRKKRRKGKATLAAAREERVAAEERAARESAAEARTVRVNEFLTVAELAELIDMSATEIISSAFRNMAMLVTINQRLDFDQIELLLDEFGFKAEREADYLPAEEIEREDDPADLRPRPPVVTVMGHVDHGKTLLLDRIRDTNVVAGESGGITQHIGAYHVDLGENRTISFLDTPGHAAFTAMRARGADVTDIVVLVVAADDAVMPQTIEAISHARNAGVPMIVAINKIDLPAADPERVKQDLLRHEVTVEDYGGDVLVAQVSAKTGEGMDDLLEKILLQAELLELAANPARAAVGAVVEAELDIGKGPVATVLVQHGTLRVGDDYVVGLHAGKVRALLDERGRRAKSVSPGIPAQIVGIGGVPQAGDVLQVMDQAKASSIAANRQRLDREKQLRIRERGIKLGDFSKLLAAGQISTLRLLVKGDVDGSVQAICDEMERLSTSEVRVEIIHRGVGAINESDVMLAVTSEAIVIGFRVRPDMGAREAARRESVEIQIFDVIYEVVDNVRAALEGLLSPERRERIVGVAEVREIFRIRGVGTIAGSYVAEGRIQRGGQARVIRDGIVVYDGEIGSLRRFKEDVREVRDGFECGIGIANFNDLKVGDQVELYSVEEIARTLVGVAES